MMKDIQDHNDDEVVNPSGNRTMQDVVRVAANRRDVVKGGMALAAGFLASNSVAQHPPVVPFRPGLTDFTPLRRSDATGPWPSISQDYQFDVLIPWGDPILKDGPAFSYPADAQDQALQIGIGHDGMWFFPDADDPEAGNRKGMLAINHEFGRNTHVLGKAAPESLADVRCSQHAHGVSVVGIERAHGKWQVYSACSARRIHINTPVTFSGPVADSELLQTPNGNAPLGTVNNCGSGYTPWGTYLTCEENFNGYFGATHEKQMWVPTESQERYGFSENGFRYDWHKFDKRFDLSDPGYTNEENRFGWVVEIDPHDAEQRPVKRTGLGRFKHESVEVVVGKDRRVVAYMGDDQRFDYIYKFVSSDDHVGLRHEGESPFDHGKLYVAKFNDDYTGEWLELSIENPDLAAQFATQAEVLTYARLAADTLGATPMDRPEWITAAPDGLVYCACTNNSRRTEADAANPQAPNADGHIIRWNDSDLHVGTSFEWDIFMLASNTHGTEESYSDPDAIYADPDGRLFILTDGGQKDGMNNQLLVADTVTKDVKRLFAGVSGDEVTGITMTPNRRTMFVNLQHVGNGDIDRTDFPRLGDHRIPRDATIVITRKDGGIIGS